MTPRNSLSRGVSGRGWAGVIRLVTLIPLCKLTRMLLGILVCKCGKRLPLLLVMRLVGALCSVVMILGYRLLFGLSFLSCPSSLLSLRRLETLRLIVVLLLLRRLCTVGHMHTLLVMER